MCGRFTLKTLPDQWAQLLLPMIDLESVDFQSVAHGWQPRWNIAPTQQIAAISMDKTGVLVADYFRWGLVPFWSNDLSVGNRMINARSETLPEKRSFAGPLQKRRCLILADGYYEWQKSGSNRKQPYWIAPRGGGMLLFAGLWESNSKAAENTVRSATIITTAAIESLAELHDRMPAVFTDRSAERWMREDCDAEEAKELLQLPSVDYLQAIAVSDYVNNARHEGPQCGERSIGLFAD